MCIEGRQSRHNTYALVVVVGVVAETELSKPPAGKQQQTETISWYSWLKVMTWEDWVSHYIPIILLTWMHDLVHKYLVWRSNVYYWLSYGKFSGKLFLVAYSVTNWVHILIQHQLNRTSSKTGTAQHFWLMCEDARSLLPLFCKKCKS